MLKHSEVKDDIQMIVNRMANGDLELASPKKALLISSLYTLPCTLLHSLIAIYLYSFISHSTMILWSFLFVTVFSIGITLISYPNSLVYLSLPSTIRETSVVIKKIRKTYLNVVKAVVAVNFLAVASVFINPEYVIAVFVVFVIGFFVTQLVLGAEMSRYGIGAVMEKTSSLMRKV
ncbi:hypothetical protein NGC23_20005 [Leclercia pneumoniae]|uniref:hypothetical protein n=1 Tax=Leclercia pneumoniae TaxID=2815358 RepID=UPI002DBFDEB3|nr:hypothetical protein [Leclercia pneumoniae]MEB7502451.1 hypothetical protein [Leclercia pneumoniae]